MGSMLSGLGDGVLGVVESVGSSTDTVARYRKCCGVVVNFCEQRGVDALSARAVEEFVACQQDRARRGEIGPGTRRALVKSARMMLELQVTGTVVWRTMSPNPDLAFSERSRAVLKQFAAAVGLELAAGSVSVLASEIRQFLAYLDRIGRGALGAVTVDDVRGFLVETAPKRSAGIGNVVWALKRFFAFLNAAGLSDVRIDGLLAHPAPQRERALPCFTREETGRLIEGIETETACGKRDYAMVLLAVSTGLRCCDIVALRLDEIDWRRDEIRLVQAKTSAPLVLPLSALAGNAVADWILHGRPECDAPEVFVRLHPPFVKLGGSVGTSLMGRHLARSGIEHVAGDGKSFHALRRTAGTRLIESGAGQPLAAQILGHARINSSRRYVALASEQPRQCCLPLRELTCTKEGLPAKEDLLPELRDLPAPPAQTPRHGLPMTVLPESVARCTATPRAQEFRDRVLHRPGHDRVDGELGLGVRGAMPSAREPDAYLSSGQAARAGRRQAAFLTVDRYRISVVSWSGRQRRQEME